MLEPLEHQFRDSADVKFRRFSIAANGARGALIYVEGLVDASRIEEGILKPLLRRSPLSDDVIAPDLRDLDAVRERIISAADVSEVCGFEEAVAVVLQGDVLLVPARGCRGLRIANRGGKARGVEDPILEVTLRGPRDAFTETLFLNTALLRRRIRDPNLRVRTSAIGRRGRIDVGLVYIEGITPPSLVQEIQRRLDDIDIDAVLDSSQIEHLIEDQWSSPFPQHLKTERPDKAAAALLEGRAVLLTDTTPFVLMMPATLDSFLHSPEDTYDRWLPVNLLRLVRLVASFLSIAAPSLYIALVAYHPDILPTQLILRIMASREGVAFPVILEALLMQFFLELIKEAGFRMPSPIGQTFGIVGGLILGDIGVRAGIVSEAMVVVIAITAISSFATVDRELATVLRLLGLPLMLSATVLGLFGVVMGMLLIGSHLAILRSYGVPYLAPYPYYRWTDLQDTLIRAPLRYMRRRPAFLKASQRLRLARAPRPEAPKERE